MTLKACIKSFRLRTLPQSLSGIACGIGLYSSSSGSAVKWSVVVFLVLTAVLLQILSNVSNELGDAMRGTDSADGRLGAHYSIMDGDITVPEMKRLVFYMALASCISGLAMIWFAFGRFGLWGRAAAFVALGALAVLAAIKYTVGRNSYGPRGLGDLFVFIFFGLVTTLGSAYILTLAILSWTWLLPAAAIGFFSVAVLNVNNIRDMKTDAATRRTGALRLGPRAARIYQTVLIVLGWASLIAFSLIVDPFSMVYVITLPLFVRHLRGVWTRYDRALDPMLPLLVLSTFATSLLFLIFFVFLY
ncbi:MAG: 1,4-dihydroxy-2-naphthoate octaprenyltransferase [Bacteroidales bacterium]|nr:1,4-dihydroxy-2-naphthoate octaprenyltransferase [Bacteroidales bacterium]